MKSSRHLLITSIYDVMKTVDRLFRLPKCISRTVNELS